MSRRRYFAYYNWSYLIPLHIDGLNLSVANTDDVIKLPANTDDPQDLLTVVSTLPPPNPVQSILGILLLLGGYIVLHCYSGKAPNNRKLNTIKDNNNK